jgi:hypothetical protein
VRALRASLRRRDRAVRADRHGSRALPDVEPPSRRGHRESASASTARRRTSAETCSST